MPEKKEAEKSAIETDYIFEPNRTEILETLIPKSIKTQVYKAILDSVASEHGARMTAMHKATDNAQALKMTGYLLQQSTSGCNYQRNLGNCIRSRSFENS